MLPTNLALSKLNKGSNIIQDFERKKQTVAIFEFDEGLLHIQNTTKTTMIGRIIWILLITVGQTKAKDTKGPKAPTQHAIGARIIVPIVTPLRDIAHYVLQTISISLKTTYWTGILPLIFSTSSFIISMIPSNIFIIPPRVLLTYQSSTCGVFPFYFCW